jgi:hypothetical protein
MNTFAEPLLWRDKLPGFSCLGGALILFVTAIVVADITYSMIFTLIGSLLLLFGYSFIHQAPLLLMLPHFAVTLLLFLNALGLCKSTCGGFQSYQFIGAIPTSAAGAAFHLIALVCCICFSRQIFFNATTIRLLMGFAQGISLYFILVLLSHQHWCPSCVASHLFMVAQAILLWRFTAGMNRTTLLLSIIIGALAMNAIFHHRFDRPVIGPSSELLGYLHDMQGKNNTLVIPVETSATNAIKEQATANANKINPIEPLPNNDAQPLQNERLQLIADATSIRKDSFDSWGSKDAPIVIRAHMNFNCAACRAHWQKLDGMRNLINKQSGSIKMILSWNISPEIHYGARLATYATYSSGFIGESEMLMALDKFFSDEGLLLINTINEEILDSMVGGKIPDDVMAKSMLAAFKFLEPVIATRRSIEVYSKHRALIDASISSNINWLVKKGHLSTPHYYFTKVDRLDQPILDTSSVDVDVWTAFIQRSSQQQGENK